MARRIAQSEAPAGPEWGLEALQVLARAGRVFGTSLDYQATLGSLAELLVPDLADVCVVHLVKADRTLRLVHIVADDPAMSASLRAYYAEHRLDDPQDRSLTQRVILTGEPIFLPETAPDTLAPLLDRPERAAAALRLGLRSIITVPLVTRGRTLGALSLALTGERRYTAGDLALVREIGDRAAVAVDHARLYHAEQEARATAELAAEEMRRLHEHTGRLYAIVEGLDRLESPEAVGRFVSETAAGAIGAAAGWVGRLDGDQLTIVYAHGYPEAVLRAHAAFPVDAANPGGAVVRTGEPLFLESRKARAQQFPTLRESQEQIGLEALAVLPLVVGDDVVGAMGYSFAAVRLFLPEEREFLQAVARHAALAFSRLNLNRELREANERLALERQRLVAVIEQMPAGVALVDAPSGRLLMHNERAAMVPRHGLPPGDEPAEPAQHPDGRPYTVDEYPIRRALAGETVEQVPMRYVDAGGADIHLLVSAAPVRDPGGRIVYAVSTFYDVGPQALIEEELRRSRERLGQVLAAARMGTWVWDIGGGAVTWDENLARVYALPEGETVRSYADFLALVHPDDREFVESVVGRALRDGTGLDYEFRAVCPDGATRWIADQGRLFTDERGNPAYMAGVCIDITDRKTAEEQLREAQKMEAVGRLAGGMAHEINNMMSVVLGFAEFLAKDETLSAMSRSDVVEIRRAAERAAGVTRQVLAFSRQQVMMAETLDLNGVVGETEQMLRRVLGSQVEIIVSLAPEAGHVHADRNQLNQVLVNLALNARDAMPGGGRLVIRTSNVTLGERDLRGEIGIDIVGGEYVELVVQDSGQGMDRATLARAFEPFFTTKPVGEGTGLGLSTVYGIVKQSHGYVWADSTMGRGSAFHVVFPRVHAPDAGVTPPQGVPVPRAENACVLIVEDEPMVRAIARRALQSAGYRTVEAEDGLAALEVLHPEPQVDLVLTDIIMPRMTGRELGRRVRDRWPSLPVLYMSGHPSEEMVRRGLLQQEEHFVQKPFHPDRLADEVARVLGAAAR